MRSTYPGKIRQQGDSMEANSNRAAARDTKKFPPEGASGDAQISSILQVAIPTGRGPSTPAFPSAHQPSSSVDGRHQSCDRSNAFPDGYLYSEVKSWQQNAVPTGQYGDHSQQAIPSETPIGQAGTPYADVNSNLVIDRAAHFNGNRPVQGLVDWPAGDALPPPPPPTAAAPT
jgi:hypothetical protein